jgi:hypothetical protein
VSLIFLSLWKFSISAIKVICLKPVFVILLIILALPPPNIYIKMCLLYRFGGRVCLVFCFFGAVDWNQVSCVLRMLSTLELYPQAFVFYLICQFVFSLDYLAYS